MSKRDGMFELMPSLRNDLLIGVNEYTMTIIND